MRRSPLRCLALDLDSTLIYSSSDVELYMELEIDRDPLLFDIRRNTWKMRLLDVVTPAGSGDAEDWWFVKRPGLSEFLRKARQMYDVVGVWTAAKKKYAEGIVQNIAMDMGKPDFVWHRDMCEYDDEGVLYKPLWKLSKVLDIPVSQITIIDDTEYTFHENPERAVHIPRWMPRLTVDGLREEDIGLQEVVAHWDSCKRKRYPNARAPGVVFTETGSDWHIEESSEELE